LKTNTYLHTYLKITLTQNKTKNQFNEVMQTLFYYYGTNKIFCILLVLCSIPYILMYILSLSYFLPCSTTFLGFLIRNYCRGSSKKPAATNPPRTTTIPTAKALAASCSPSSWTSTRVWHRSLVTPASFTSETL